MGTNAHVLVAGPDAAGLVATARDRLGALDRMWSRFRPDSEISRLNGAGGMAVPVTGETVELVRLSVRGWRLTGGRFDPTVHDAMVAHGYDCDFARMGRPRVPADAEVRPSPGCRGIDVDAGSGRVRLPAGVRLDPGGIAKGLAADLVCDELLRSGATGVLANVGGDLRVGGTPPGPEGWVVAVADPVAAERELLRVSLRRGAVATGSTLSRRWVAGDTEVHHVMDPRTGRPSSGPLASVTVVATAGWLAEVLAQALLVADDPAAVRLGPSADFVGVTHEGKRVGSAGLR